MEIVRPIERRVIYTALMGDYESFSQPKYSVSENTRLVLLTDSQDIRADGWEVKQVRPRFPNDMIRSSRYLKVMGPRLFPECGSSLWIDNTVLMTGDPEEFIDNFLVREFDIAVPFHSKRASLAAEFSAVATAGYDDFARIYEQLFHYQAEDPDILKEKPFWTGILARKHTAKVTLAMEIWFEQILRYSRRDQLSFNYAIKNTGLIINGCQLDNNFSEYHEWPVKTNRKTPKTKTNNLVEAINDVPIARLAQLEYENGLLRRTGVTKESTFQRILARLYKNRPAVVVQVGACDGKINDPIYDIIKSRIKTSTVVLIEPQPELIDILKSNYEFHPDVRCENIAIGPRGQLILYRLKKTLWSEFQRTYLKEAPLYRVPCGFVSQSYDHVLKHIVGRLPNNILVEQAIEKLEVESKELIDVLNAQNIKSVDILQIDAEGLDDQVIYHCNIDRCKPSIIHFEHIHLGIDKKLKLHKYLRQSGYVVCEYSKSDTLAISTQLNDIPTDLFPVGSIL